MRIAFLGASLTEGRYGGSYVEALRPRLPEHTLLNFGVNGSTTNRLLERVDTVLEAGPDAVFVLAGSNDAIAYSQPKTRPYYRSTQGLPDGYLTPDAFQQLYRELITHLQLAHVHTLIGVPPLEYNPAVAAAAIEFNHAAREVGRAYNVPVCDLAAALMPLHVSDRPPLEMSIILRIGDRIASGWHDYETEQVRSGFTYSFDGIHFTPAGADRAAEVLAVFLREHLR